MRPHYRTSFLCFLIAATSCAIAISTAQAQTLTVPYVSTPPTIGGDPRSDAGWGAAFHADLTFTRPDGTTPHTETVYLAHDGTWLYVGVVSNHPSGWDAWWGAYFDGNNDGKLDGSPNSPHVDLHNQAGAPGAWGGYYGYAWDSANNWGFVAPPSGTQHVSAGSGNVTYELKTLLSDLTASPGATVGMFINNGIDGSGVTDDQFPSGSGYNHPEKWAKLQLAPLPSDQVGQFAFVSTRPINGQNLGANVWFWDGVQARPVTSDSVGNNVPDLSPDRKRIVLTRPGAGSGDIYTIKVDGTQLRRLTRSSDCSAPRWSPDGKRIVFQRQLSASDYEIYWINADGSNQAQKLTTTPSNFAPAWSRDGQQIAFHSTRDGRVDVWEMNEDGTGQHAVTHNTSIAAVQPQWSPDNLTLAFRASDGQIYTVPASASDGSPAPAALTAVANASDAYGGLCWTPDQTKIVFANSTGGHVQLYIADTATGIIAPVFAGNYSDGYPSLGDQAYGLNLVTLLQSTTSATAPAGTVVKYSFSLQNAGWTAATNVTMSDTIPPGLTFDPTNNTGWTLNASGSGVTMTIPSLAARGSNTFTLRLKVASNVTPGTTIYNLAVFAYRQNGRGFLGVSSPTTVLVVPKQSDTLRIIGGSDLQGVFYPFGTGGADISLGAADSTHVTANITLSNTKVVWYNLAATTTGGATCTWSPLNPVGMLPPRSLGSPGTFQVYVDMPKGSTVTISAAKNTDQLLNFMDRLMVLLTGKHLPANVIDGLITYLDSRFNLDIGFSKDLAQFLLDASKANVAALPGELYGLIQDCANALADLALKDPEVFAALNQWVIAETGVSLTNPWILTIVLAPRIGEILTQDIQLLVNWEAPANTSIKLFAVP